MFFLIKKIYITIDNIDLSRKNSCLKYIPKTFIKKMDSFKKISKLFNFLIFASLKI